MNLNSLLSINKATVFIESDIADDNYEFQEDSQGSYTDWAKGCKNAGKSSAIVHKLQWEISSSFQLDTETISVKVSSENIEETLDLEDNLTVLSYYEPKIMNATSPNASYRSFYFSLECLYNAGVLADKLIEYFNNEVFYPDFAKGFFFPDETLFCKWEEASDQYLQHYVCEHFFNELVARDYLKFYRPKIDSQSIEIHYSPSCTQPNSTTEPLIRDFEEFINAGYYLAVCKDFPTNVGNEIIATLPIKTKQWLAMKSI